VIWLPAASSSTSLTHSDDALCAERVAEFIRCWPPGTAAIEHIAIRSRHLFLAQMHARLPFFRELREVFIVPWRGMQWPQLLRPFLRLSSLSLLVAPATADWLPAVLECATLEDFDLSHAEFSAAELQLLVRALPRLSSLSISHCRLESVSPLAEAHALTSLALVSCDKPGSSAVDWLPLLPPLPLLAYLTVSSPAEPEADRAQRSAALLERMPRLVGGNLSFQ